MIQTHITVCRVQVERGIIVWQRNVNIVANITMKNTMAHLIMDVQLVRNVSLTKKQRKRESNKINL